MRRRLERFVGTRRWFRGTFVKFGTVRVGQTQRKIHYMLVLGVQDERSRVMAEHTWVRLKEYVITQAREGDEIEFTAEVTRYFSGPLRHRRVNYGLYRPLEIQRIEQEVAIDE